MPTISLTDLVDVVSKSGTPKATKVNEIKNRGHYNPATDFYKPLRDALVSIHEQGLDKSSLNKILTEIGDQKKLTNYPSAIDGYRKWWKNKSLVWFDPVRSVYSHGGIDVGINPELGLMVDDQPYLIKLYLKSDPLSKLRIDLITVLMEVSLRSKCNDDVIFAILDVRNSKLFKLSAPLIPTQAIVNAELAYISALWPSL